MRLQINDQEFLKMVANATSAGIVRATTFLHSQCKLAINVPNTGVRVDANSVKQQAGVQLNGRKRGLVKITTQRRWKDEHGQKQTEDVTGWYRYDDANFAPRTDKSGKTREVKSVTIYPYPSKPGEPPRKRTGWLQRHVLMEFATTKFSSAELVSSRTGVGRNAIYGLYLELGTRKMKARPWLVATLLKHKTMLTQLLQSPT